MESDLIVRTALWAWRVPGGIRFQRTLLVAPAFFIAAAFSLVAWFFLNALPSEAITTTTIAVCVLSALTIGVIGSFALLLTIGRPQPTLSPPQGNPKTIRWWYLEPIVATITALGIAMAVLSASG